MRKEDVEMLSQIQRFGGAMFSQCCCFPSPGLWWVLPSCCKPDVCRGITDRSEQFIRANRTIIEEGGWTVFRNMPLIFAVVYPLALLSKRRGVLVWR